MSGGGGACDGRTATSAGTGAGSWIAGASGTSAGTGGAASGAAAAAVTPRSSGAGCSCGASTATNTAEPFAPSCSIAILAGAYEALRATRRHGIPPRGRRRQAHEACGAAEPGQHVGGSMKERAVARERRDRLIAAPQTGAATRSASERLGPAGSVATTRIAGVRSASAIREQAQSSMRHGPAPKPRRRSRRGTPACGRRCRQPGDLSGGRVRHGRTGAPPVPPDLPRRRSLPRSDWPTESGCVGAPYPSRVCAERMRREARIAQPGQPGTNVMHRRSTPTRTRVSTRCSS